MPAIIPQNQTAAYTVVTPNHFAHASSLKKSFLLHNPGCYFFIGLIGYEKHIPTNGTGDIIYLNELQDERISGMAQRYNPFELSCAFKPFFANHIFATIPHINRLIYLDGDMYVFGPFTQQTDAAITLSPHRTVHVNFLPGLDNFSAVNLLRYGVYNAGYFELIRKPEAILFINWWQTLMENHAYNRPDEHFFVDQLWLSAAPSFFDDIFINKNPGYNASVWNLIERKITIDNNEYYVNGEPLIMFHYSTYSLDAPDQLLNFEHPALSFATFPELKPVFKIYKDAVLEAGYEKIKLIPHPFNYIPPAKKKKWWKRIFS
jgi:hypothetical protein